MKIRDLETLMKQYGNVPIGEIIESKKGINHHECPKCNGSGVQRVCVRQENYGYWEAAYENRDCDLCHGVGYTARQLKAKVRTEIIGYE